MQWVRMDCYRLCERRRLFTCKNPCVIPCKHSLSILNVVNFFNSFETHVIISRPSSRLAGTYLEKGMLKAIALSTFTCYSISSMCCYHALLLIKIILCCSLGEGSYSKVKEALDIITLQRYAVKIMKVLSWQGWFLTQKLVIKFLKHQYIIE